MPRYFVGTYPFIGRVPYVKLATDDFHEAKNSYTGTGNYTACIYDTKEARFLEMKTGTNFDFTDTTNYLTKLKKFILEEVKTN